MKHTPADHPDVYYLETAMECLHSDLTLLDKSIQACQFASTVSNLKEDNRGSKRYVLIVHVVYATQFFPPHSCICLYFVSQ